MWLEGRAYRLEAAETCHRHRRPTCCPLAPSLAATAARSAQGKKRAQKDRAYLTATEWREEGGGFKKKSGRVSGRLPFDRCAISFQPFEDPVGSWRWPPMDGLTAAALEQLLWHCWLQQSPLCRLFPVS